MDKPFDQDLTFTPSISHFGVGVGGRIEGVGIALDVPLIRSVDAAAALTDICIDYR